MTRYLAASTCASAILLLATGAMADVTADQVWTAWRSMSAKGGQTIAVGKEEKGAGTVTITDLTYTSSDDTTKITGTVPSVVFKEQGDGTVAVTSSDAYDLAVTHTGAGGEAYTSAVKIAQAGQRIVVSGTPETMSYDYKADSIDVDVGDFTKDGKPYDLDIAAVMRSVSAAYVLKPGDALDLATTLAVAAIDFKASGTNMEGLSGSRQYQPAPGGGTADGGTTDGGTTDGGTGDGGTTDGGATDNSGATDGGATDGGTADAGAPSPDRFQVAGTLVGVAGASTTTMNGHADPSGDFARMLSAGFMTQGSFNYDSLTLDGSMTDPQGMQVSYSSRNGAGKLNVAIDADRLSYDVAGGEASVEMKMPQGPMPDFAFAVKETRLALLVPLAKSETPRPFALDVTARGLTLSEGIWALFDPEATIPRDPANIVIDLKGTATPRVSLANPAGIDAVQTGEAPPADLNTLEIADLEVTAGGASLKGTGQLAFDQMRPKVLGDALPMPTGKVNLSLDGANDLLGKLMALGVLPAEAMMGFGMVTAMVAKPGPTPDSFVSEIEFTADGKILANGNPLPIGP